MTSIDTTSGETRALRWIGDLDHSFYDDERQRFVWYESSAIGFQLFSLLQYAATGVALLIGGADAMPYLAALIGPLALTTYIVVRYSSSRGASYLPSTNDVTRGRGIAALATIALLFAGLVRASASLADRTSGDSGGFWGGFQNGISWGAATVAAGIVVGIMVAFFRKPAATDEHTAAEPD